ncbi:MAG TPA: TIGR03067 domain-containing protein [Gemmataceae bacterium]|jgi:uncharacterized protein (TIGR03067 family)|nr:TIGR03067 domain-containing protein [Gemmataceae bacterium]
MIRHCVASVVLVSLLITPARGDEKAELKKLEGTWLPTTVQQNGRNWPDEQVKGLKLVIADGKYTVTVSGNDDKGTLKVDPNAKPATMDIVGTDGPNKGRTIPAIYDLSADTLKICYGLGVETRPTQFESKPGTRLLLITYKREKP